MKSKTIVSVLVCLFCYIGQPASEIWGFSIISPLPTARVEAGSIVRVSIDADNPGTLAGVMFTAYGDRGRLLGGNFVMQPPFTWTVQLPPDYTGSATIHAAGTMLVRKTGNPPEATTTLYVTLPLSVTLQGMTVRGDQNSIFMRPYSSRTLSVFGQYSDGVERDITVGVSGTTYASSNNSVAVVDANGTVTARGSGKAQITAKNGNKEVMVSVIVQLKP
jgi:hypothetical protein